MKKERKLPWFRLYSKITKSDEMNLISFQDRWHFIVVLCLENDGVLDEKESDIRNRKINKRLGLTQDEADELKKRLIAVGLIDAKWHPVAWDIYQYPSDNATARVRKWRTKNEQ